ncbi:MAG: hypothetical protein QM676_00675 [Novosphingobium sp.]
MKRMILALSMAAVAVPVTAVVPGGSSTAEAKSRHGSRVTYVNCRKSPGTTGLIVGGVAGAVVGGKVIGGGIVGPAIGAVGGALGGRAIDRASTRHKRCRAVRR